MVDAVEANALHGGRMSAGDSVVLAGQTAISNGFGASVGLEAAYAQVGGMAGSLAAQALNLRRGDWRVLVGAGAGAAIAAAFGAPLTGAFYAFEIVIGAYTPAALAPVAAASLAGALTAQTLGIQPYVLDADYGGIHETHHYLLYALLGAVCAVLGILLMRAVALTDQASRKLPYAAYIRPTVGGLLLIPLALYSPQVLSSGHGALHVDLAVNTPLLFVATIFVVKAASSVVSLGFGFRGGLFFASLFLGTLVGHIFAVGIDTAAGAPMLDPVNGALVGMAAMAAAVVGGPMTMAMLVLEATHSFTLTGAVIAAALVANTIVRETFGFSFSTWRLHLRGQSIRSARDVGWMRSLTAGSMMRRNPRTIAAETPLDAFRRAFPLGSATRAVLVDADGRYAGILPVASAWDERRDPATPAADIAVHRDASLNPELDITGVLRRLDAVQADELAVVDADQRVIGLLSDAYVRRRYAEELEKAQRDLFGEA